MATIKNEFDYIQEARSQLAEALVNKFGVREQDILNADGSIKSTGLWASNSDGSKNYLKRLHDWAVLVTATNVHTDASLTFKNDGSGDAAGTTFNGSVARSISYNSIGAAPVRHTHTTKIETSTNASQIALAYGGKYKLTAGGATYVFTMPSSDNTWRPIGTGANDAAAGNHVHKNLIIKWDAGDTEGTNLFTYNGRTAKTIDLSTPFSQLFTNFGNADTGYKSTDITATIGGTTKSFAVNWAAYTGRAQIADKWTTARTLTIGSTGKSVNGSENVSWTLAEIGAADSSHTHRVVINDTSKLITASPAAVNLGSYLPLEGGTMTGAINFSNTNARLAFGDLTTSPITGYIAPELQTEGVGIYTCLGGTADEGAIIITEDTCVIYNSADAGWNFQVLDTDYKGETTGNMGRSFGINQVHQAWSSGGFVKEGSSNNYVLLGGGGHKAISDFAMSGHTHSYLPLVGGTMAGQIVGNNKGGNWIAGRTNAAIYQSRNTTNDWHPVIGFKTDTGSWEFGSAGQNDDAAFSWGSDSNYNSGRNTTKIVYLRNINGTIALTSEIPTVTDYYWANVPIGASSNIATNPTFGSVVSNNLITAISGIQIGAVANMGWYTSNSRMCSSTTGGYSIGVNVGSLLVSDTWTDSSNVPTNGIYSKGDIITPANIKAGTIITPGDDSIAIKPAKNNYDFIGSASEKFWGIYSNYFYGNLSGTADNANALNNTTKSKFVYANGDFGTSDVTDSSSLTRTQFWRDNNRQRIGVFVSHHSNSRYGWEISASYPKNGDFTGRIKENGTWGDEYTFLTDLNFIQIINATKYRELWINGYDSSTVSTSCPVIVMHWPNREYSDLWYDGSFHFGNHASYNNGADLHATNYYTDSDIRYKNVVKQSCIDLSSLATLPLFLYTWNDKRDDIIHIGSSAQAVEQVIPQLVTEDSTGFKSLNYSILGTVAGITACKELVSQKSEIEILKERVKQLEQQLKMYNG